MLQEGAASLVSRLVPVPTAEDWYQALLTAQDYLLSLGITGWQDAIIGRDHGDGRPHGRLPARRPGGDAARPPSSARCGGTGTAAWSSCRSCSAPAGHGAGGRFRATSVKMMLDGVAENHTAAMLEPYLDGDGCATGHSRPGLHRPEPSSPAT